MEKILILGGTGMLGHTLFAYLSGLKRWDVYTTSRSAHDLKRWMPDIHPDKMRSGVDADNFDIIVRVLASIKPDIVINCIGLIKQLPMASDPLTAITVNSQLPHRISLICSTARARMIHISTDCVFDGAKGHYTEADISNSMDLYGRTKYLGEVSYPHCVTIRTSMIGHELKGYHGLIEWFLHQKEAVKGFSKAIFSGFPTVELAQIIASHVIPRKDLKGVYHVAAAPISKLALLRLVALRYGSTVPIEPCDELAIDRSLDASRFNRATGYTPPDWQTLIDRMYTDFMSASHYRHRAGKAAEAPIGGRS